MLRTLARSIRHLFHRHPEAAPLILRCCALSRPELELYRACLDALTAAGLDDPAAVLRVILSYVIGTGYAEVAMLGVQCDPGDRRKLSDREILVYLGQALPPGTPHALTDAAVTRIADCDPDRLLRRRARTDAGRTRPSPATEGLTAGHRVACRSLATGAFLGFGSVTVMLANAELHCRRAQPRVPSGVRTRTHATDSRRLSAWRFGRLAQSPWGPVHTGTGTAPVGSRQRRSCGRRRGDPVRAAGSDCSGCR